MKRVHNRTQYIGEKERLGEYKGSGDRVWKETECRVNKARKVKNNKEKRFKRRELLEKYIAKMLYG